MGHKERMRSGWDACNAYARYGTRDTAIPRYRYRCAIRYPRVPLPANDREATATRAAGGQGCRCDSGVPVLAGLAVIGRPLRLAHAHRKGTCPVPLGWGGGVPGTRCVRYSSQVAGRCVRYSMCPVLLGCRSPSTLGAGTRRGARPGDASARPATCESSRETR